MHTAPLVVHVFVQICQHESAEFNKPAEQTDETKLAILGKIVIGGISTVRSVLRAVANPTILSNGIHVEIVANFRT
jgi:hypothetical protein